MIVSSSGLAGATGTGAAGTGAAGIGAPGTGAAGTGAAGLGACRAPPYVEAPGLAQQKVQASMAHVAAAHLNRIVPQYRRLCARQNKCINANKTGVG